MSTLVCPKNSDKVVLDTLLEVSKMRHGPNLRFHLVGDINVDHTRLASLIAENPELVSIINASLYWNESSNHFGIEYTRIPDATYSDTHLDRFRINQSNQKLFSDDETISILSILCKNFRTSKVIDYGDKTVVKKQALLLGEANDIAKILSRGVAKATTDLQLFISQQATEYDKQKRELSKAFLEKEKKLFDDFDQRKKELDIAALAIETQRRELDDKSSTHARREIRRDLLKIVENRSVKFRLSEDTNGKRTYIHSGFWLAIVSFFGLYLVNVFIGDSLKLSDADSLSTLFVKFTRNFVPVAGFFATIFIYIRWMNSWAQRHADFEFGQRQFELDINRASWAVESALEWRQSGGSEIPEHLLQGITQNLFQAPNSKIDDNTSLDDLASVLLGNAARVRLKTGENEIEFDPKGLRKLGASPS